MGHKEDNKNDRVDSMNSVFLDLLCYSVEREKYVEYTDKSF